jgi:hypothetical protein
MMKRRDEGSSRCDHSPLQVLSPEQRDEKVEEREEEDLDQVGEDWTNHTIIYMRRALKYCRTLLLTAHGHHVQPTMTKKRQQRSSTSTRAVVAVARS